MPLARNDPVGARSAVPRPADRYRRRRERLQPRPAATAERKEWLAQ